ncbi:hypothetical protein NMG60_11008726 [Bertholletia excelsa]
MPPKAPPAAGPRRALRTTARKSTLKASAESTGTNTDAFPTSSTSDSITSPGPVSTAPKATTVDEVITAKSMETTPITSTVTLKSSTRTPKSTSKTSFSNSSVKEVPTSAALATSSDATAGMTVSAQPLPETSLDTITKTNLKNSEDIRDPIVQNATIAGKDSGTAAIVSTRPQKVAAATTKSGGRTLLKKTVRVVKKVVKKKVPKRSENVQTISSSNEEYRKIEVENEGVNPNPIPIVLGAIIAENPNPRVPQSPKVENLISERNAFISMETENLNSDPNFCISMDVDNSEVLEAANREDEQSMNEKFSDLVGGNDNANQRDQVVSTAEFQLGDQNVGLHGKPKEEIGAEDMNLESGEGKKGVEEVDNIEVNIALKEEVMVGDGCLVLSGEMEALERRKRRKTEIFVGGLDKDAREEDIRKVFEEVGDIVEVRLVMNDKTGKNKGFAFVRYASAVDAKKALSKFAKVEICGKECGSTAVEGNDTIFLGNIDKKWKSEDIIKLLQEIGIEKIDKVTVVADPSNIERNRGFAFVELETSRDAQNAYRKLQKKDVFGKNQKIKVAWAEPLIEPDEEEILKVKSVYAEYLPSSWDEEKVKDYFKRFGEIENVVLAKNLPSSKRKDFAFVNYTSREAALACIEAFNRKSLHDEDSQVNIKVSLARPMHKGKQVKHVSNSVQKEPPKEKPTATQPVINLYQHQRKGKSAGSSSVNIQTNHSSTTAELVQLLREQASWKQPQTGLAIGCADPDYSYSSPSRKRSFSLLGDEPLYSDPRGYPHTRLENSFPGVSTSRLFRGVSMSTLPYGHRHVSGYESSSLYGVEDYPNSSQTRGRAPQQGISDLYHRY